jgi:hypothetical protein
MADDVSKSLSLKLSQFRQGINPAEVSLLHFALESSGPNATNANDAKAFSGKLGEWAEKNLTAEERNLLTTKLKGNSKTAEVAQTLQAELHKQLGHAPASNEALQKVNNFDLAFVASCHHPATIPS